jgi:hypothetical protein
MSSQSEPEVILYDLKCIKGECFSPAVWKSMPLVRPISSQVQANNGSRTVALLEKCAEANAIKTLADMKNSPYDAQLQENPIQDRLPRVSRH